MIKPPIRNPLKTSLGFQITLSFVVLFILTLLVSGGVFYNLNVESLRSVNDQANARILRLADLYFQTLLGKTKELSDLIYGDPEIQKVLNTPWESWTDLERYRITRDMDTKIFLPLSRANPEIDSLWILRQGEPSFGSHLFTQRGQIFDPQGVSWFSQVLQSPPGSPLWIPSRPSEFDRNNNLSYGLARKLPSTQLNLSGPGTLGIVVVNIHQRTLQKALDLYAHQVETGSQMVVIANNGQVVAHTDKSQVGSSWLLLPLYQSLIQDTGKEGRLVVPDKPDQRVSWLRMPNSGWWILTITPTAVATRDVTLMGQLLVLLALGNLVLAALLGVFLSRWITKPISAMAHTMAKVERGDLSARYENHSQNELGTLSRSLNRMMDELQKRVAELNQFNYAASHDLKTPLITMKGFLGILQRDLEKGNVEQQKKDIERVIRAADRMGTLVTDLLEISRLGNLPSDLQFCSLTDLILESKEAVDGLIQEKWSLFQDSHLPVVKADPVRLRQVFQNLLENSLKYRRTDTPLSIHYGARETPDHWEIYVKDNGIGIAEEHREQVFKLFHQLSKNAPGTGVGLTLVKKIVESHGGKVWIESPGLGQGTTVRFTLPKRPEPSPSPL